MKNSPNTRFEKLCKLFFGSLDPPSGKARIFIAVSYGIVCHLIFTFAVLAMMIAMFFGMSKSLGNIPSPWSIIANIALVLQFPLAHSFLLTKRGSAILSKLAPFGYGNTLSTTTFAILASVQLLLLFALWTPSGFVWWYAEGWAFVSLCALYAISWLFLMWASFDAGAEVQSGALGWMSLIQKIKPEFPDMPTHGLFKVIRQPIYVAFALTTWTAPVWTPDQLCLAMVFTAYCLLGPVFKERRFSKRYGTRFKNYKAQVPYAVPGLGSITKRPKTRG